MIPNKGEAEYSSLTNKYSKGISILIEFKGLANS